ncbi:MAG: hypothetical protein JNG88_10765 [Phycisphaerales bacterium]|nr:hypothetical protein [Phycisphaerales bacterium]
MRALFVLAAMLIASYSGVSIADFRLWLETRQDHPQNSENPQTTGSSTLYLWGMELEVGSERRWNSISFNIAVEGPACINSIMLYQARTIYNTNRWSAIGLGDQRPPIDRINNCVLNGVSRPGVVNPPIPDTITNPPLNIPGYDAETGSVLLGEFHFAYSGAGEPATVWLEISDLGIWHSPWSQSQRVFLGFGDEPVRGNDFGARTTLPEATIIPEPPATGVLVLLGLMTTRRRNR